MGMLAFCLSFLTDGLLFQHLYMVIASDFILVPSSYKDINHLF